ncbi:Rieske (2Fe-2S) protein [Angustibacter aerolatus]
MATDEQTPLDPEALADGRVHRAGEWAVGTSRGEPFAVSRRCRHQLADLSEGSVDADGCLVCPWHASRYDVRSGEMVSGPRGFLGYHGPTPGYSSLIRYVGRLWRLRVGRVEAQDGRVVVRDR